MNLQGQSEVEFGSMKLKGLLGVPEKAQGVIIFAHGSGSGRLSPRNNHVAAALRKEKFATLLLDLLTAEEEEDRRNIFDIALLARRLLLATAWVREQKTLDGLNIGYFGASTGAGAALVAAADPAARIAAVVSRGGRPDLAGDDLLQVHVPVLLIVGRRDDVVLDLNRQACKRLPGTKELRIIPGAGHLFEEPGTLDQVVDHAVRWFRAFLPPEAVRRPAAGRHTS